MLQKYKIILANFMYVRKCNFYSATEAKILNVGLDVQQHKELPPAFSESCQRGRRQSESQREASVTHTTAQGGKTSSSSAE